MWSKGDVAAAHALYAQDFVSHQHSHPGGPRDVRGRQALIEFMQEFRRAFPDFHDTVQSQVAEGDLVATRYTSAGTHKGPLMGFEPAGKRASWMGLVIDRIADGKIAESWVSWDMIGMLQEIGVVARFR